MYDVEEALQYQNMSYLDALNYTVGKNIDLILISIDNVLKDDCTDDNAFTIWRALAAPVENKNKRCHSSSYYDECWGIWMVKHLKYMLRMFHHMDMDDVIQDILLSINQIINDDDDDGITLWDAIHLAVENHANEILGKAREVKKKISERIIPNHSSGSGMYLNPWRHT